MSKNKPELDPARLLPLAVVRPQLALHDAAGRFKRSPQQTVALQPSAYLDVQVDGRETSYFEWLGAGIYCTDRHGPAENGRSEFLHELRYGFSERFLYLRVDTFPGSLFGVLDFDFHITLRGSEELRLLVVIEEGRFAGCLLDTEELCILGPHEFVEVAFDNILEVAIGRRLVMLAGETKLMLDVALWRYGAPVEFLPRELPLEVELGADAFAWPR